jgi:hypothetical protein
MQRQTRATRQGPPAGVDAPSARNEALALAAYHEALREFGEYAQSRRRLLERLGDVDGQATHPVAAARLALAGRLIAAAQLAEPVRLPELQVHGIVRAWLTSREAERDDAAPSITRRVAPEERVQGLTQRLMECEYDGGFSRTAWGIAGMVLQHVIRPTVEVSRALGVRATLEPLAAAARAARNVTVRGSRSPVTPRAPTLAGRRVRSTARWRRRSRGPPSGSHPASYPTSRSASTTGARWSTPSRRRSTPR